MNFNYFINKKNEKEMKMLKTVSATALVLGSLANVAMAKNYIKFGVGPAISKGYQFDDVKMKENEALSMKVGLGREVRGNWSIEAELDRENISQKDKTFAGLIKVDDTVYTLSVDGVYSFKNSSKLTPFVGLGGNVSRVDTDAHVAGFKVVSDDSYSFGYNGKTGLNYKVSDLVSVGAEYKYKAILDVKNKIEIPGYYSESVKRDLGIHSLTVNFVRKF